MAQLADIRARVIKFIGEVTGTSVQTYSEPRVDEALIEIYLNIFRKAWWPQYMKWYQLTLSGTNGLHTSAVFGDDGGCQHPEDIRVIIPDGDDKSLPVLPTGINPYNIQGTRPVYWEALEATHANVARRFRVWPLASTGDIYVHARVRPTTINESTENYFDDNLLVFGAAWLILEQEDINTNAAALAERMFSETYADIHKALSNQPQDNPVSGYRNRQYLSDWSLI